LSAPDERNRIVKTWNVKGTVLSFTREQKDSPLFSGLDLPQDAIILAVPVVDGFKRLAEQRCHKPDDESAVYPAALFEPF
jgi:hypothetical protein